MRRGRGYIGKGKKPEFGDVGGIISSVNEHSELIHRRYIRNNLGNSQDNPAESGLQVLQSNPQATDGNYWITRPNGDVFQVKLKMDYGGGWMNITQNWGTISNALTAHTTGNTGYAQQHPFDSTSAGRSATEELNTRVAQLRSSGSCLRGAWEIRLSPTMISEFGFTEYRARYYVNYQNAGCAGLGNSNTTNRTIITDTGLYTDSAAVTGCNSFGSGNAYAQLHPSSFTFEHYGDLTSTSGSTTVVANAYTVCEGDRYMNASLKYLYLR